MEERERERGRERERENLKGRMDVEFVLNESSVVSIWG